MAYWVSLEYVIKQESKTPTVWSLPIGADGKKETGGRVLDRKIIGCQRAFFFFPRVGVVADLQIRISY